MLPVVLIAGFTEDEGEMIGTYELERKLRLQYGEDLYIYPMREWCDDMGKVADRVKNDGFENCIICGYSWGGGFGAQKLANALIKRGVGVPLMLLCDPVYRPQWLPTWGVANLFGFRALIPHSALIKVNDRVGEVDGIRQVHNIPQGHDIKHRGRKKELTLVSGYEHSEIDNSPVWHELVSRRLAECIAVGGAHDDWSRD